MSYPSNRNMRPPIGRDRPKSQQITGKDRQAGAPARTRMLSRPYNIAWLDGDGRADFDTVLGPAVPVIEATCANVGRGTLIATVDGPVAVEDLVPGQHIMTTDFGPLPLQWVGSYDMGAREVQLSKDARLFRVTADTFGLGKPASDLMLAPRAHLMLRHAACKSLFGMEQAYAPIRAYEDGQSVISTAPMSTVSLFNLAFDRQATIVANGVELESFHPGAFSETLLDDEMLYSLMRLFPQARSLESFGPQLTQRLTVFEVNTLREGL